MTSEILDGLAPPPAGSAHVAMQPDEGEDHPQPLEVQVGIFAKQLAGLPSRRGAAAQDACSLLAQRVDRFREEGGQVLSYDVFDTLLLRDDKCEARRYWELAERTAARIADGDACGPARVLDHYIARNLALEISYRARPAVDGCREGHIAEVLRTQVRFLGYPERYAIQFHEIERAYELERLSPNAALAEIARHFAASGGRVILVSDMYLSSDDIAHFCRKLISPFDFVSGIYSSADWILNKRSGLIFPRIAEELGVPASAILHVGDSLASDVRAAQAAGWQAVHFPISNAENRNRLADLASVVRQIADLGVDPTRWAKL